MLTRRAFAQFAAATVASAAQAGPGATAQLTRPEAKAHTRAAEAQAVRKFAERTSPRGLEAASSSQWQRAWAAFEQRADGLGDAAYVIGLRRLLGWFHEGHTTIVPFEFLGSPPATLKDGSWGRSFPIKARPFHDGLWITEAAAGAQSLLGTKIRAIGGRPVEEIMHEHANAWPAENPAWAHNWAGILASSAGMLQGLGIARGPADVPLRFDVSSSDNRPLVAMLTPQATAGISRDKLQRVTGLVERQSAAHSGGNFSAPLDDGRALFISIDDMADLDGLSFARFTEDILANLQASGLQRLVIDLRRNGGGDNYLAEPLRHELARSRFNRPGGLYVLIGPATFSAAQNFANRLERECFATFVGEPTGSAPNLVGDAAYHVGAVTGVTAMVARLRWFDGGPDDRRRWIAPDIPVPSLYADWLAGRDPALDAAIAAPDGGAGSFAARVRYFERDSQKSRWNPFWNPE